MGGAGVIGGHGPPYVEARIELRSTVRRVPVLSSEPYLQSKFLSLNDDAEKDQERMGISSPAWGQ